MPDGHTGEGPARPNVVIIICDDLGYGDLGCYGGTVIRTPRLDALAASGARFTSMYSGGPTCTPARAALLTGRVAVRTGASQVNFPGDGLGLHHTEQTIASYLSRLGYRTAAFGKWHVGGMPGRGPLRFGFDYYFGLPYSNDTPPIKLYENETVVEEPAEISSLTRRYAEAATRFIEDVPDGEPFFVYVANAMPHYVVAPEEPFTGRSAAGPYGDVVEAIDHYAGELYDAVRRKGVADNTIFIFTSDHGPWFEGSTGGLRGRKFDTWEGGVRVPFILTWPDQVPAGTEVSTAAATIDVLPTLCAVTGLDAEPGTPFDGQDIRPQLSGGPGDHGPIWYFDANQLNGVRRGRWKLHRRRHSWGDYPFADWSLPELFDLERDPLESYDLSARHPDIVAELLALMERFAAELGIDVKPSPTAARDELARMTHTHGVLNPDF
jgi:arylsulfatase A